MQGKKHYHALDWMKTLAIFFVLFYHTYKVDTDFLSTGSWIAYLHYFLETPFATAVPLFFTVNGFLLLGKPLDLSRHWKRMKSLFCLTIFWDAVCCAFQLLIRHEHTTLIGFVFMVHDSEILWFLRALFVLYVFLPLIKEVFDHNKKVFYFTLLLFMVFSFGNKTLVMLSNILDQLLHIDAISNNYNFFADFNPFKGLAGYSFAYFMIGGLLSEHLEEILGRVKTGMFAAVLVSCWVLLFGYGVLVSFHTNDIYDVVYPSYGEVFTCLMTVSVFCLFSKFLSKPVPALLQSVSANTLGIYCVQWPVFAYIKLNFGHLYGVNYLLNFVVAVFVLAVCTLIVVTVRKIPIIRRMLMM